MATNDKETIATKDSVTPFATAVATKYPLRDIRDRMDDWGDIEIEEGDYVGYQFKAGDVVVNRDGEAYLIGDRNRGLGYCSCCSLPGSQDYGYWKGYIPFEDYANV